MTTKQKTKFDDNNEPISDVFDWGQNIAQKFRKKHPCLDTSAEDHLAKLLNQIHGKVPNTADASPVVSIPCEMGRYESFDQDVDSDLARKLDGMMYTENQKSEAAEAITAFRNSVSILQDFVEMEDMSEFCKTLAEYVRRHL
jgi:hypothetical protein